jgi:hypothetical protein
MKTASLILLAVLIFTGCACEAGRVIEIKAMPLSEGSIMSDSLSRVAREMGMIVEGPETGPGGIIEYRARYPKTTSTLDFYINVRLEDPPRIFIRTLNIETVGSGVAERALELFRDELNRRGAKYSVRRG